MARYSSGKHAYLIDDRTGRKIRYRHTRTEWTGKRVHKSEFEEKHPQITPPRVRADAQVLFDPRVDTRDDVVLRNTWDDNTYWELLTMWEDDY